MEKFTVLNLIIKLLLIISIIDRYSAQTQCKDESGNVVDWYVVYKFPKVGSGAAPIDTGLKYSYITSESTSGWVLSSKSVDSATSIFGETLNPVYSTKTNANLSYFFYNDEPPEGATDSTHAHAKGVVVADDTNGYWLIHSVPHFSSAEESLKYAYPSTGLTYGQVALCISVKASEIDKVVDQLIYMEPKIYSSYVSSDLQKKSAQSTNLKNGVWTFNAGHDRNTATITSSAGVQFTSFSKNARAGVDLYDSIVGPALKTALYVETWRKNPGTPLNSTCSGTYHVENVAKLKLKFTNSNANPDFPYTEDHSKWAISQQSTVPYVCVGDINRMESQFKRGGGTTCFQSKLVWTSLHEWIEETEKC
jgi:deoxyribonuclease-2